MYTIFECSRQFYLSGIQFVPVLLLFWMLKLFVMFNRILDSSRKEFLCDVSAATIRNLSTGEESTLICTRNTPNPNFNGFTQFRKFLTSNVCKLFQKYWISIFVLNRKKLDLRWYTRQGILFTGMCAFIFQFIHFLKVIQFTKLLVCFFFEKSRVF